MSIPSRLRASIVIVGGLLGVLLVTGGILLTTGTLLLGTAAADEDGADHGDSVVRVSAEEIHTTTRFLAGKSAIIDGTVSDAFAFASSIELNGTATDNLFVFAEDSTIRGNGDGDVFACAEDIAIHGTIRGDVYVFSKTLHVLPEGRVHGNIYAAGEEGRFDGPVDGELVFAGAIAKINAPIGKSACIKSATLTFGDEGHIAGDLTYEGHAEPDVPEGMVGGEVRTAVEPPPAEDGFGVIAFLALYFATLTLGGVLLLIVRPLLLVPARTLGDRPAVSVAGGFVITVLLGFLGGGVTLLSLLGLPLGRLSAVGAVAGSGSLWFAAFYVASLVTAVCFGEWIQRVIFRRRQPTAFVSLTLGLLALQSLALIPLFGFLVTVGAGAAGLGSIVTTIRRSALPLEPTGTPSTGAPMA